MRLRRDPHGAATPRLHRHRATAPTGHGHVRSRHRPPIEALQKEMANTVPSYIGVVVDVGQGTELSVQ